MRSWLLAARGLVFGVAVSRTDKVLANIMKAGKVIKSREDVTAVIVGIVLFDCCLQSLRRMPKFSSTS